jgi:quinol-cytochrome oxidoreductase complex cytochrome b subunit
VRFREPAFITGINWGDWSFVCLYLSIGSGIAVGLHYDPSEPFYSTSALDLLVPYGAFFRSLHFYSSQFFFLFALAHYVSVFSRTERYQFHRFVFLVLTLPIILLLLFTGYVLRGDSTGFSAGMIAESIVLTIPFIGNTLNNLFFAISSNGMQRVYLHHIITFDVLFLLLAWHHVRHYSTNLIDHGLLVLSLLIFCLVVPAPLKPHLPGQFYITGPWFFLGLQELLRYLHPFVAGVLVPLSFLASLIFLRANRRWFRPLLIFICCWLLVYGGLSVMALTLH